MSSRGMNHPRDARAPASRETESYRRGREDRPADSSRASFRDSSSGAACNQKPRLSTTASSQSSNASDVVDHNGSHSRRQLSTPTEAAAATTATSSSSSSSFSSSSPFPTSRTADTSRDEPARSNQPSNISGRAPKFAKVANPFYDQQTAAKFGNGLVEDAHKLEQRLKQIQFGKNTIGYDNYLASVPKEKRGHPAVHPRTPNVYEDVSKRAFDGMVRDWRRRLHQWDNPDVRPDLNPELVKGSGKRKAAEVSEGEPSTARQSSEETGDSKRQKKNKVEGAAPEEEEGESRPRVELAEECVEEFGADIDEETYSDEDVL